LREKKIKFYELFEDELIALLAAGHSLSSKKYLQAKEFGNEIKHDFGIAVISRSAVQHYLAIGEVRALPITSHGLRRVWRAATRAGKRPPETLTALVEALQRESAANVTD
jgi:hypothetical protein